MPNKEVDRQHFKPLKNRASKLEILKFSGIVLHQINVQLVHKFVIFCFVVENRSYDAIEQGLASLKKEILGDALVPVDEAMYDLLVGHKRCLKLDDFILICLQK